MPTQTDLDFAYRHTASAHCNMRAHAALLVSGKRRTPGATHATLDWYAGNAARHLQIAHDLTHNVPNAYGPKPDTATYLAAAHALVR